MENIPTTHDHEKGELSTSQSGGYDKELKINNASLKKKKKKYPSSLHIVEV